MGAAAYKGQITFVTSTGRRIQYQIAATDTNTVYYTSAEDGLADFQLPLNEGQCWLAEVNLVTGGTDCRKVKVWVNGKDSGYNFRTLDNLNTSVKGSVAAAPLPLPPGARVAFQQLTQAT